MSSQRMPAGIAAEACYTRADGLRAVMQIAEPRDPFDLCNAVRERLFPGVRPPDPDLKFDAVIRARARA